jgi:hypothetical protein
MNPKHSKQILDLLPEWECRTDPRQAIRSDYLAGVRSARETLASIVELSMQGLIPQHSPLDWWPEFIKELLRKIIASKNS